MIVLDGVGCGELPDAAAYGDAGSNTLGNVGRAGGGLRLPNLGELGLGNVTPLEGVPPVDQPRASFGKLAERSAGKDTTTGHWEMMGIIREDPFPTYPNGFPPEVIAPFEEAIGRATLGNKPASGTVILEELGREHLRTGSPIVYTSADSVFQIAAHESVFPLPDLYRICEQARELLTGEHAVARVIARPFVGEPSAFIRTPNRRDFSLPPPYPTTLDLLVEHGHGVLGIGKISEIFAGRGLTRSIHTDSNAHGISETLTALQDAPESLTFVNLVDFDTKHGHRNDPHGFAEALAEFDQAIPDLLAALRPDDTLLLTADHGCDPTTPSTDHSREYVPVLVVAAGGATRPLGTRTSFADIGATVASVLGCEAAVGRSVV
ncbi:MAG: phosphopentomutase [Armatimonadetes bacterium CG_4_10_14_3_um_filter_66_18]|nr:phosphopentomutase [Armatimonadota bacterium]PIU89457.1 MAG: phosphopentomutase [Armatimonadetes bacterium CG06_land_8_20_14_3_00_66_21]PIX47702.1 MAG: phosphopentomutase [Armatimonadetes bacterium CG_4_8_14_3_um_filter_66_20]PIY54306.1 MAG: phosphopentomutase [Armatimonadetes bacterium CG_4_10_14_3_um_filter_66_18]PIZ32723.1 MAG: phosphopentomutase [Armatimonadetes bacterium CG_4_10_14_0_8_um_filter_66_14]PJB64208.1 MAG: phosphopentomutase [Armatimonadetes bacterium CG_4_9_14_3_um_filter_6